MRILEDIPIHFTDVADSVAVYVYQSDGSTQFGFPG